MGATITQDHGYLEARSPNQGSDRLKGAHIVFDKITVTGTEDLLMAATLAEGETIFENCAREPEVTDLAALLIAMGAKIEGAGTATIRVQGVSKLHGARHRINPDRIEAGTFLVAGAITGGDLNVDCCEPKHLGALISKLEQCGVKIDVGADYVRVRSGGELKAADMTTEEYPGFPTDMQAQYMALATQAEGTSSVTENIFENRFMHVQAAKRRFSPPPSCALTCALQRPSSSLHLLQTAKPSSTASTISIAATSTSRRSSAASGPRSVVWVMSSEKGNQHRYTKINFFRYTNASSPVLP